MILENIDNFIYLGFPIGDFKFIENYWVDKMRKTQKAFYSLNGLGCRKDGISPITMAKIYKIYCQPIINYGLEMLYIRKGKLKEFNSLQSSLIKMNIGLSKKAKSTELLQALNIESISDLYYKFKIIFFHQIKSLKITTNIFDYLCKYYNNNKCPEQSYIKQMQDTCKLIEKDNFGNNKKEDLSQLKLKLNSSKRETDPELVRKTYNMLKLMIDNESQRIFYLNILRTILDYRNFTRPS